MLYLLNKDVRTVRWNGEPLHEATSAIVKETMNGDFTLTVKYPISDSGIYQLIQEDMLIKAPTPVLGAQLFRIKKPVEHNDYLEITAYHISDDVMQRSITPVSVTSQSCGMALSRMVQNTKTALGDFSFNSDIQDRRTFNTTETETLYSVLLDGKHSIVGTWEGELVRDNFALTVKKSRGENRGVVITTHKNLKDYQRTRNSQNVVTRIHAKSTFKPEGAEKETTIRVTVDSPLINSYPYINEKEHENNNAKTVEELQKWAQAKFTNQGIDKVSDAIKIEAYELDGQVVHMGDTVNLKSWKHNVDVFKKAITYEFDALKEEYITLTFDDKAGVGGSRASGGLSSAADAILGVTESAQEIALEKALQNADLDFDHKAGLLRQEISDGIELAKARAEEVKRELSDTIDQRFSSFNNGPLQEVKRRAEEALRNAGASSLLAQEAKRIGLDSVAKLEAFKAQTTSAQTALSGDLDVLKRTVTSEVNQASEYRRMTTEALSRMTDQMNGFATKSEVKQDIDGLTQTFAKMKVGGRNYAEDYDFSRGLWIYSQGDGSPIDWKITNGEYNVKGTTRTWKQMQIHSKEGSRASGKNSTALLDLEIGETYTLSFQGICYSGNPSVWISLRANRTVPGNPEIINGNFNLTSIWQTYQVTIPALTKPDNFDFWRIILGYNEIGHVAFRKVELTRSSTRIDAGPAPEDGKTDLVIAKSEFQKTAEGLSTKLAAVETYVNQDSQRQEALRRYTREESAKQATAVRELVSRDFVGKASYQEDVRGLERRFSEIATQTNNNIATKIAQYKQTVDGQFASITSQMAGKANQTDFQRVQETSKLYERVVGSNENDISNKVARMALTNQLFQVEVAKAAKGGRNYIRNGQFKNGSKNWIEHQSVNFGLNFNYQHSKNPDNRNRPGLHFYHESQDVANFFGIQQSIAFDGVRGEKVTVSLLVSKDGGDANSGLKVALHYIKNKNIIGQEWQSIPSPQITSKYKRFTFTFTLSDDVENLNLMLYGEKGKTINLYVTDVQLERGSVATDYKEAPEDTDEAVRSVQSQLAGSWAVQNLTSAGSIISQINATNNQVLIEAEKIRLKGKTLLDELTAIQGYFKRLLVGEGTFATLNADIIRTNSITADKLVFNEALANRMVSNEIITSKLVASRAFVNALKAVTIDASQIVTGTLNGDRIYGGTIRGTEINGTTITGNSRITIGDNGFLRPTQEGGLQINVPETYSASKGIGVQLFGRNFGQIPKGMFIYNSPNWNGGNLIGESVADTLLTVKGLTSLCNLYRGKPMSGLPINSNFRYGDPVGNLYRISFIAWDPRHGQMYVNDGTDTDGTWWFKPDASSSDKRLKTNIQDTNFEAIDFVKKLEFKQFDWKPDKFGYKKPYTNVGLIAQDVEKLDSSLVYLQGENLALDDFRLGNIALKAIQELSQRIETLERKLA